MNNITKDTYHMHNESQTCGDECDFNDLLEKSMEADYFWPEFELFLFYLQLI